MSDTAVAAHLERSRQLVTAHNGHTGYRRSEVLGGACFWLSIPTD